MIQGRNSKMVLSIENYQWVKKTMLISKKSRMQQSNKKRNFIFVGLY